MKLLDPVNVSYFYKCALYRTKLFPKKKKLTNIVVYANESEFTGPDRPPIYGSMDSKSRYPLDKGCIALLAIHAK